MLSLISVFFVIPKPLFAVYSNDPLKNPIYEHIIPYFFIIVRSIFLVSKYLCIFIPDRLPRSDLFRSFCPGKGVHPLF